MPDLSEHVYVCMENQSLQKVLYSFLVLISADILCLSVVFAASLSENSIQTLYMYDLIIKYVCAQMYSVFLFILHFLKCVYHSLFKDSIPNRNRQQAVNIVGNRAPLDKQKHSDHHCYRHTQPCLGMAGNLQMHTHRDITKNVM